MRSKMLKIVGFGSGSKENMTLEAVRAIQDSELVVGFRTYVELLKQYFPDKQYYSTNMMQERERCQYAIDRAKEGKETGNLADTLMEELQCKTVFTIPVFGGIPVAESVAVTWVIMAVLLVLSLILVRNLKVENPGKKQLLLESGVSFLLNFFEGILGEEGKRYIPYLMSTVIYIGIANIAGVFGFTPPTKDMNVTIALSLMSIILIEYSGFHKRGLKGFLHSFAEPVPIMLPINILELAIRPTSLCMRLFGNVLGSFVVMKLLEFICPAILPIPFSLYFDFFDGFIQAYVFVFLTSLFIKEAIE